MASTEVSHNTEHSSEIDTGWRREPSDAPSARFGWHHQKRGTYIAGAIVSILFLLGMLKGNHIGHIEDIYLISLAVVILIAVVWKLLASRGRWS